MSDLTVKAINNFIIKNWPSMNSMIPPTYPPPRPSSQEIPRPQRFSMVSPLQERLMMPVLPRPQIPPQIRLFKCHICSRQYTQAHNLSTHIAKVHERPINQHEVVICIKLHGLKKDTIMPISKVQIFHKLQSGILVHAPKHLYSFNVQQCDCYPVCLQFSNQFYEKRIANLEMYYKKKLELVYQRNNRKQKLDFVLFKAEKTKSLKDFALKLNSRKLHVNPNFNTLKLIRHSYKNQVKFSNLVQSEKEKIGNLFLS